MRSLRAKTAALATVAFVAAGSLLGSIAVAPSAAAATNVRDAEVKFGVKLNKFRAKNGKGSVSEDTFVRGQARIHTNNMAEQGFFDHRGFATRFANIQEDDPGTDRACENIARASGYSSYVEAVKAMNKALKKSDPHRDCMLSALGWNANQYGIGVYRIGDKWWATMILVRDNTPAD